MDEDRTLEERPDRPARQTWVVWAAVAVGLALGGLAFWWTQAGKKESRAALEDAGAVASPQPVADPDGGAPLDPAGGDALVRRLGAGASPEVAKWLESPGILQRIAAAARMISRGESPRSVLGFLEVPGEFAVKEEGARIVIDPKSYARYDATIQALATVDAASAGKTYAELRPYFDAVYGQIAAPGERFDDVLRGAIKRLLEVKVPEGEVELVEKGAIYAFKDPTLESRPQAEKHLLRMGPTNAKRVQDKLRDFATAAGMQL